MTEPGLRGPVRDGGASDGFEGHVFGGLRLGNFSSFCDTLISSLD